SVWGDACVFIPLSLYHNFGDKAVLSENFEMMKKWMEYIAAVSDTKPENWDSLNDEQKERNKYLWTKGFHFGDWLIPSLRERPDGVMLGVMETAQVVGACAYAIVTEGFIEVCRALGEDALASEYEELLKKIRAAICAEFVAEDGRVNNSDLQGNYVMILKAGACEGPLKEKVLDYLVKLIEANKGCLDTGFSSVSHLLDVLYDNGRKDIAYKLLWQTEAPSWLYMVKMGATTIWENWKAVLPDGTTTDSSYNHYAFGCVGEWMYRHMGGIKALAPGFSAVRIEPDTDCGLKECSLSRSTEYGEISCSWKLNGNNADICAVIPEGVTAELVINNETRKVSAGTYNYTV
ncbi:MAG: alpha-L-rhamnosidase, partial [Parasporobacterium sp.]|nr:alpha-L-rhamnosidase [Parasporobacterium sp.]